MKVKSRLVACVQDERLTFTFIPPSRSVFAPREGTPTTGWACISLIKPHRPVWRSCESDFCTRYSFARCPIFSKFVPCIYVRVTRKLYTISWTYMYLLRMGHDARPAVAIRSNTRPMLYAFSLYHNDGQWTILQECAFHQYKTDTKNSSPEAII